MRHQLVLPLVCLMIVTAPGCRRPRVRPADTLFSRVPVGSTVPVLIEDDNQRLGRSDTSDLRERREQIRDWLLLSALHSSGQTAEAIARAVPNIRFADKHDTVGVPHGPTRVAWLAGGRGVVLVPPGSAQQHFDQLAQVSDEYRKDTGTAPQVLYPFEYQIDPGGRLARLRRLPSVTGTELYSPASGYTERVIRTPEDLDGFLGAISDLTGVSLKDDAIVLAGRKPRSIPIRGVSTEYVAALYQADKRQREENAPVRLSCGFSLDPFPANASRYLYQAARYDCDLGGTATGMVLFYTDLVGKLWALDYERSFPRHIQGFLPPLRVEVSTAALSELQALPRTRLWFGPRQGTFSYSAESLAFGRTSTRVFARSSGVGGQEVDPNVVTAAFIGWWNDHYDEVATWEPEYQRLNQIMKWSLVLGWLDSRDARMRLRFLDDLPITRSHWFPSWAVSRESDLRFRSWDRVHFYPRGYAGTSTEAMDILRSEPYERLGHVWMMSGGVSLASPREFRDPSPPRVPLGRDVMRAVDGSVDVRLPRVEGDGSYRSRGAVTGDTVLSLNRPTPSTLEIRSRGPESELSRIKVTDTPNGLALLRDRTGNNQAQTLVDHLTELTYGTDAFDAIASFPGVEMCIKASDTEFFVAFKGQANWLKLHQDSSRGTPTTVQGRNGHPADSNPAGREFIPSWVSREDASRLMTSGESITVHPQDHPLEGVRVEVNTRGPPDEPATLIPGLQTPVRARRGPAGALHFARSELPDQVLSDPRRVRSFTSSSYVRDAIDSIAARDYGAAADAILNSPDQFRAEIAAFRSQSLNDGRQALHNGDYSGAIAHLAPLAEAFTSDPEILVPLATARLAKGEVARAAAALTAAERTPVGDVANHFEVIERLRTDPHITDSARTNLLRHAQYLDALQVASRDPEHRYQPVAFESWGRLEFSLYLLREIPRRPTTLSDTRNATRYIGDPDSYNVDWQPTVEASMGDLGPLEDVLEWAAPELGRFQPATIVDQITGERFIRLDSPAQSSTRRRYEPISQNSCLDCDDRAIILPRKP